MAWESIRLHSGNGRGARYGQEWWDVPAVAINKTGLTFNQKFQECFDCRVGTRIALSFDKEGHRLGFKVANGDAPLPGAGILRLAGKSCKGSKGRALLLACKGGLGTRVIDCIGYAYRAHLNAGERVIEVSLDPSNRCT